MEILRNTNFDFMKYRKYWVIVSLALVLGGIFSVFVHGQLNVGIDFAGGTQISLQFRDRPPIDRLRVALQREGMGDASIQRFGGEEENEVIIRTRLREGETEGSRARVETALNRELNPDQGSKLDLNRAGADAVAGLLFNADPERLRPRGEGAARARYQAVAGKILAKRREAGIIPSWDVVRSIPEVSPETFRVLQSQADVGNFTVTGTENVGPQIGEELRRQGFWVVVLSLFATLAYIWFRFELRFGIGAIMACVHDVLVTLLFFTLFDYEFNLTTIAAFLTLIGYSVNDTVVIFDRIRENMRKNRRKPLIETMNESMNQTLARTILTGGSTLLALAALLWLGSDVIEGFAFVMFVGILVGTYSSIYVASPFALLWEQIFGTKAKPSGRSATARTEPDTKPEPRMGSAPPPPAEKPKRREPQAARRS